MPKINALLYSEEGRCDKKVKKLLKVFSNDHPTTLSNYEIEPLALDNNIIVYRITLDVFIYDPDKTNTEDDNIRLLQGILNRFVAKSLHFGFVPLDGEGKPIAYYGPYGFSVRFYCDKGKNEEELIKMANAAVKKIPYYLVEMSYRVYAANDSFGKIIEFLFGFAYHLSEEDRDAVTMSLCYPFYENAEKAGFKPLPKDQEA